MKTIAQDVEASNALGKAIAQDVKGVTSEELSDPDDELAEEPSDDEDEVDYEAFQLSLTCGNASRDQLLSMVKDARLKNLHRLAKPQAAEKDEV